MLTIAVTGVGADVGQGIVKALRISKTKYRIIGTDIRSDSAGLFRCDAGYLVPPSMSPRWKESIIDVCRKERVSLILVGAHAEVPQFARFRSEIEAATGATVVVSPRNVVEIACDKWKTHQFLVEHGFDAPATVLGNDPHLDRFIEEIRFPLVVKPRKGSGSKDLYIVSEKDELSCALSLVPEPVVQEYVGDAEGEYTCGVMCDMESNILGAIVMKRKLRAGSTHFAYVSSFPRIEEVARKIVHALKPLGPWNLQMRVAGRRVVTIEMNPRFSGTTIFRANVGFNEPQAIVDILLSKKKRIKLTYKPAVILRYADEVYVPISEFNALQKSRVIHHSRSKIFHRF